MKGFTLSGIALASLLSLGMANSHADGMQGPYIAARLGTADVSGSDIDLDYAAGLTLGYGFEGVDLEYRYTDMEGEYYYYDVNADYHSIMLVYRSSGSSYFIAGIGGSRGEGNVGYYSASDTSGSGLLGIGFRQGESSTIELEYFQLDDETYSLNASYSWQF